MQRATAGAMRLSLAPAHSHPPGLVMQLRTVPHPLPCPTASLRAAPLYPAAQVEAARAAVAEALDELVVGLEAAKVGPAAELKLAAHDDAVWLRLLGQSGSKVGGGGGKAERRGLGWE